MFKFFILIFSLVHLTFLSAQSDYSFGWTHLDIPDVKTPRGGTTKGPSVTLDNSPSSHWVELKKEGLTKFEKDRLAILSMQGQYRVYFDFMETMGFVENYIPQKPYQSWATEYVFAVENDKNFISLQHIIVMFFEQADGSISDPAVVKHWRQDWHFQDITMNTYKGFDLWKKESIPFNKRIGSWSQSVYQVDDSPRYQGFGYWQHYDNFSSWVSNETWRPLPRREASIRNDYDVIIGTNIQTITPDGWVHEQNNKKVVLKENKKVLAKEIGIARYQRIKDFDWSAGEEYWENTKPIWKEARIQWNKKLEESETFKLKKVVDGKNSFLELFRLSSEYAMGNKDVIYEVKDIVDTHSEKK